MCVKPRPPSLSSLPRRPLASHPSQPLASAIRGKSQDGTKTKDFRDQHEIEDGEGPKVISPPLLPTKLRPIGVTRPSGKDQGFGG